MTATRVVIIANPMAGNGRARKIAESAEQAFCASGINTSLHLPNSLDELQRISLDVCQQNETVVLACGMWTRELARTIGVTVPLHACEHFYILTETFEGVTPDLPVYRDYDHHAYYKEDAGKILLGAFEPVAKPWGMDGISPDFCFDQLPDDFDHFEPILEAAIRRMPALENAGIQTFFCGPESFTPDDRYHLGAAPELENLFIAAGMNSIGVQSAGGVGHIGELDRRRAPAGRFQRCRYSPQSAIYAQPQIPA